MQSLLGQLAFLRTVKLVRHPPVLVSQSIKRSYGQSGNGQRPDGTSFAQLVISDGKEGLSGSWSDDNELHAGPLQVYCAQIDFAIRFDRQRCTSEAIVNF